MFAGHNGSTSAAATHSPHPTLYLTTMKKLFLMPLALGALALVGCKGEEAAEMRGAVTAVDGTTVSIDGTQFTPAEGVDITTLAVGDSVSYESDGTTLKAFSEVYSAPEMPAPMPADSTGMMGDSTGAMMADSTGMMADTTKM